MTNEWPGLPHIIDVWRDGLVVGQNLIPPLAVREKVVHKCIEWILNRVIIFFIKISLIWTRMGFALYDTLGFLSEKLFCASEMTPFSSWHRSDHGCFTSQPWPGISNARRDFCFLEAVLLKKRLPWFCGLPRCSDIMEFTVESNHLSYFSLYWWI